MDRGRTAVIFNSKWKQVVGFLHLASRGGNIDWLKHLFVLKEYRQRKIAFSAINLAEKMVSAYSPSWYIKVAARNSRALKLYRKVGYDCLNTITIYKDFKVKDFEIIDCKKNQWYGIWSQKKGLRVNLEPLWLYKK